MQCLLPLSCTPSHWHWAPPPPCFCAVARGTEAIERELDSVLSVINTRSTRKPEPPPASKAFMANLPILHLSEAKLEELGKDCVCAVCTDELRVDDKVQLLPCKYVKTGQQLYIRGLMHSDGGTTHHSIIYYIIVYCNSVLLHLFTL